MHFKMNIITVNGFLNEIPTEQNIIFIYTFLKASFVIIVTMETFTSLWNHHKRNLQATVKISELSTGFIIHFVKIRKSH
jgi:hypothetical protein